MNEIPGYIQWVRSHHANRNFPVLVFCADFVTVGMESLTSTKRKEVVVTMYTAREWSHHDLQGLQKRVNRELGRSDLRCVDLIRAEESRLVYQDLFDKRRRAFATHTQSLNAFRKAGGVITRHRFEV
jgi:hypothetical protein